MDCNKEEGEKCQHLGSQGNLEKALRFFHKSAKLYPTPRIAKLISETEARLRGSKEGGNGGSHPRATHREAPSPTTTPRAEAFAAPELAEANYTGEQKTLVEKVLVCTDYYAMLFLSKECTDADIKKAYKKLALQLHPDKNQAPKAEDAFKAISQAFACLSDAEKRRSYDRFGFDPDNRQPSPGGSGGGGMRFRRAGNPAGAHFMFNEEDISPEEIFNMFFFGVPPRGGQGRGRTNNVYTFQRGFGAQPFGAQPRAQARAGPQPQRPHQQAQQQGFFAGLLQLLPILLMLALLVFSAFLREEPMYKLEKTGVYTVPMKTQENQFDYYVREDFNPAYRSKVEEEVDTRWVQYLRDSCYAQMQEKKSLVNKARWMSGDRKKQMMEEANNYPLDRCEILAGKGFRVPNYTR